MTILQNIKEAALAARKLRDADNAASLTTLLSEVTMIGKNDGNRETTDVETIAVIKKFIKNIDEFLGARVFAHGDPTAVKLINEKSLYNSFLPKQLDEAQIRAELMALKNELNISGPKGMGELLKAFKIKFEGSYDGGTAAKIAKEIVA
jgi:hypothetical protein